MTTRHTLFFGLIMCIGCAPFSLGAEQTLVPFEVYPLEGISYRLPAPLAKAVTNLREWNALWREIEAHSTDEDEENDGPRDAPKVDFKHDTLLVVAAGGRPSGGYFIGFDSVREQMEHADLTCGS